MLQKVTLFLLALSILCTGCHSAENANSSGKPAEVMVLATIHKFHSKNPDYSYQRVTEIINAFNPDLIAIEIRPEDLGGDSAYLAQFYPQEMRTVLQDFPPEKVRGLDWYGNEIAGKKLEPEVFKDERTELGKIKKLERELNRDSVLAPQLVPLAGLGKKQIEIAMNSTAAQLNNGDYDSITNQFYQNLEAITRNTPYQVYTDFNRQRDSIIAENLMKLVKENPGKKNYCFNWCQSPGPDYKHAPAITRCNRQINCCSGVKCLFLGL